MPAAATASMTASPLAQPARKGARIALLLTRFPSVTETFILREVIEMERQGCAVRLVPVLRESPPVVHEEARPWIDRALYTPFVSFGILQANLRALMARPARCLSLLVRLVAGTVTHPGTLLRTLLIFPKSVFIAGQLRREGIQHVHAHYATYPSTMALIIAALADIPFSFTVHAHDIQLDRSLLRWKLRQTRFVRSISEFNRRFLERLYPQEARDRIDVIHVGIEPLQYAHGDAPIARAISRVLCVAAHKPYKGLPYLIEACRLLKQEGVSFRCEVVGDGPMREELKQMILDKGVGDVIQLVGPKAQHEVTQLMAAATLFVLPSIIAPDGQMEGIPVALMEAMSSGRPVVSTSISGIPELVEDGQNGFIVPPADAPELARAMRALLESPELARAFGQRGREKVRAEFSIDQCVAKLLDRLQKETAGAAS